MFYMTEKKMCKNKEKRLRHHLIIIIIMNKSLLKTNLTTLKSLQQFNRKG